MMTQPQNRIKTFVLNVLIAIAVGAVGGALGTAFHLAIAFMETSP